MRKQEEKKETIEKKKTKTGIISNYLMTQFDTINTCICIQMQTHTHEDIQQKDVYVLRTQTETSINTEKKNNNQF